MLLQKVCRQCGGVDWSIVCGGNDFMESDSNMLMQLVYATI